MTNHLKKTERESFFITQNRQLKKSIGDFGISHYQGFDSIFLFY